MEWKFTTGGTAQNEGVKDFLEENKFKMNDIRSQAQNVTEHFVAWKKSMSIRTVRERFKEGQKRQIERIVRELKDKYGQYMAQQEIEEKAVLDEEDIRNSAIERRFRALLHASIKKE